MGVLASYPPSRGPDSRNPALARYYDSQVDDVGSDASAMDRLPRWGFASPGRLRDTLTALALAGTKTTTASLLAEFEADGDEVPSAGDLAVLVDSVDRPVALIETIGCRIARLADVDDQHAIDEGEGYANAREFREAHERFWGSYLGDLRQRLGDPGYSLDDETLVVLERFRVVRRFG